MIIGRAPDIPSSDITPERQYLRRREFVETMGLGGLGALALTAGAGSALTGRMAGLFASTRQDEAPNSYDEVTSYNNFYEFGTDKEDPKANSGKFKPKPWSIAVDGLCAKPGAWTYEDLIKPHKIEDRTYRLRCVEAWSMVIPWQGIPLAAILKRFEPQASAKYVAFTTVMRPREMMGQNFGILPWPYVEGLRMDEAMHPLTILATGLYGKPLPNQNGAPIRLIVPWKYGFKGIKSIVRISFVEKEPPTTWSIVAPTEYGFYANVNPDVDHPRWTQSSERRIGEFRRRRTVMFNGYADQVASMYAGMDLKKNY